MSLFLRNATSVFLILISGFFLNSCKDTTSVDIEESLEFIRAVEPIGAGQNVSINIKDAHEQGGLFTVELSGIQSNTILNNGTKKAWCIEYDVPPLKRKQEGVKLHSTKGKDLWKPLNYFLNKKEELKLQYPDLGWREIQIIIWSLVEHKPFNMNRIGEYEYFSSEFYSKGQYLFDVELTKKIVQSVKSNFGKRKGFSEENFAIIVENEGQTIIVEPGESVWSYGQHSFRGEVLREFLGFPGRGKGQWGWIFELKSDHSSTELIAGGSNDDGTKSADEVGTIVGNLEISKRGDLLQAVFNMNSDHLINDLRFWAGCSLEDFPWKGNGNVAPGSLPYHYEAEPTDYYVFSIDLNNYQCSGNIFISAHAGELYFVDDPVSAPVVSIQDLGTLTPEYTDGYARGINDHGEIVGEVHEWYCIEESSELSKIINDYNLQENSARHEKIKTKLQHVDNFRNLVEIDRSTLLNIQVDGNQNNNDFIALRNSLRNSPNPRITSISSISSANYSDSCAGVILFHEGFRWTQEEGMSVLPGSFGAENLVQWAANDINNHSQVAGYAHSNYTAAFWDKDNTKVDVGLIEGGTPPNSDALAINDKGQVVGYKQTSFSQTEAFIWSKDSGMRHFGTLPGHGRSYIATDINNSGQVVGWSQSSTGDRHYFLWDIENGMTDLGTDPVHNINNYGEISSAAAVNDQGQTVKDGKLYDPQLGEIDLGTLDGGGRCTAFALNNNGQVAGWCQDASNEFRPVMWTISF